MDPEELDEFISDTDIPKTDKSTELVPHTYHCSRCKRHKKEDDFSLNKRGKLYKICEKCRSNCNRSRPLKGTKKGLTYVHKDDPNYKACGLCGHYKQHCEFVGIKGVVKTCAKCRKSVRRRCEHDKNKYACKQCGTYRYIPKAVREAKEKERLEHEKKKLEKRRNSVKELVDNYETKIINEKA